MMKNQNLSRLKFMASLRRAQPFFGNRLKPHHAGLFKSPPNHLTPPPGQGAKAEFEFFLAIRNFELR